MNFEERLDELIADFVAGRETREEAISALELATMRLKEEQERKPE
jgi:hypothetical protein